MKRHFPSFIVILLWAIELAAKPLLTDHQSTYVTACQANDDTPERIIAICEKGLLEKGASDLQKIDMLDSLGDAHLRLDAYTASQQAYDRILELDPKNAIGWSGKGWVSWNENDIKAAQAAFERSIESEPTASAMAGYAASMFKLDQIGLDDAIAMLDTSLAIAPRYSWAKRQKGWIYIDAGDYAAAEQSFQQAIDENQYDAAALSGLAQALRRQDRYEEALTTINLAFEIAPDETYYFTERSIILYFMGRYKQAVKDADQIIQDWPDKSMGYVRKARALAALGRRSLAHDILRDTEEQIGRDRFLTYWRASLLVDDERFHDAATLLQREHDGERDLWDNQLLAFAEMELGNLEPARVALDIALGFDQTEPWNLYYDALLLTEEKQFDRAQDQFFAAIENGLPVNNSKWFIQGLAKHGEYIRAVQIRVRLNDMAKENDAGDKE